NRPSTSSTSTETAIVAASRRVSLERRPARGIRAPEHTRRRTLVQTAAGRPVMISRMSRQTRIVLLGLAGAALVVMLYDASAPWRSGQPVTPATTPALESPRSEIQRGLDKTPL